MNGLYISVGMLVIGFVIAMANGVSIFARNNVNTRNAVVHLLAILFIGLGWFSLIVQLIIAAFVYLTNNA